MVTLKNINKYKIIIFIFLGIELLLYIIMSFDRQSRIKEYLADTSKAYHAEYNIIFHSFQDKAKIAFDTLVDKDDVKNLFQKASVPDISARDTIRKQLFKLLLPEYKKLKGFGFKQVHFHLPDNHSFLRMHAPDHYGDDLSGFRKTVKYVNQTHRPISGFEEGVAYNGFRFVYPLFKGKSYLGSVELSFSAYALSEYIKSDFLDTTFMIAKKSMVAKSKELWSNNYITSPMDDDFVIERHYQKNHILDQKDKRFHDYHAQEEPQKAFSLDKKYGDNIYIETFIPIHNPITKQTSAYLIMLSNGKYLNQITQNFWFAFGVLSLAIILLFMRYTKGKNFHQEIQQQNQKLSFANKRLKTIIDVQENMIIITNGTQMSDANAKVLQFFGYHSFEQLHAEHTCICDFFIPHKGYFHLGLVPKNQHWIPYINTLPEENRVVNMIGREMEAKAFQIEVNKYAQDGSSVISLRDVTDVMIEKKILRYRAEHDNLTDIYNRRKIDDVLLKMCQYSARRKEHVGLIMFDIDHFKLVNDNYGHDTGDEVLKTLARLVKNCIREEDIFGRWGGEEFMLVMRHSNMEETYQKAQQIRAVIEKHAHKEIPKITASFGVTALQKDDTLSILLKRVDTALYEAKSKGRNCVIKYDSQHKVLV